MDPNPYSSVASGFESTDAEPGTSTRFLEFLLGFKIPLLAKSSQRVVVHLSVILRLMNAYAEYICDQNSRVEEDCFLNFVISFPCKSGEI